MVSKLKFLFILFIGLLLFSNVNARCDSCDDAFQAFEICDMSSGQPNNCYIAELVNIESYELKDINGEYFSIRDNIIYLNNSKY